MKSIGVVGITLVALALSVLGTAKAAAAAPAASCSAPTNPLLKRIEIELPGKVRVTHSVDIPANTEVLIEAFETGVDSRLEVRKADGEVSTAESALHRWTPHRLIVPRGAARKADITVVGLDRAHGKVDVRISSLASRHDRRCTDFWHAMAEGDTAFSRGRMIFRSEIEAPPGAAEKAYDSALIKYARAAEILGPGGLDEAQTRLVRAAGLMTAVERYPEALEESSVAQARFEALGHEYGRDLARFHRAYSLAYVAMQMKDATEAKKKFETAGRAFQDLAASHLRRGERFEQALALDGLACTYGFLYRYGDAITGYRDALAILEDLHEPDRAISIRSNLGYFETQFGRLREGLKRHREILAEGDNTTDPLASLGNLRNIAYLEMQFGQYDAALRHYSDIYARSLRIQSFREQAWSLYGLGSIYRTIGNYGEALNYLEQSLELRPDEQRPREITFTLRTLANLLTDMGRGREAIARREEALRNVQVPLDKARVTLELIDDRIKAGDLAIAKKLIASMLEARDITDPTLQVGARLASARISLAEGDARTAARDSRDAANYYREHELPTSEFQALLVQAQATCASGARDEALAIAEDALQRAEEIRTFSSNPTLRASLWRPIRPAFGFTIDVLARKDSCGTPAPTDVLGALAIAEASRGRALEDFRRRIPADSATSRTNDRRRELFEQLAGVRQQLEVLSGTVAADDERLAVLRTEASRLRREIDLTGALADSRQNRTDNLRLELRARIDAIPKDSAIVEYWIGKDEAFAWLLTRGRAQLVDLGSPRRIDEAARAMHDAMHDWLNSSVESRLTRAQELHALIIAPLPAELSRARTVYFIPDGALHAVPFAALAKLERGRPRYLVESHDVAVAPAFLAIAPDAERRAIRRNSAALVIVDPVYARDDRRFTGEAESPPATLVASATLRGTKSWVRLPATASEAKTISRLLEPGGVRLLSGFDANRDTLLGVDLANYDILHFATHAVADTEAPQLSALILSTVDTQGKPRIGEVFAGDLADQRLDAGLVVFSGCETAMGRTEAGEGLLGLRYAAHASGARAVIASLWPVMDATGPRLMDDLYAEVIEKNASPVAALSRAMRNGRKSWNDPALWASFDVSIAGF